MNTIELDTIFMDGYVTARYDNEIIFTNIHNKFVDAGLLGILSYLIFNHASDGNTNYTNYPGSDWYIYLGTNTTSPTLQTMTALSSPIGTAPGTAPSTRNKSMTDGSTTGIWETIFTASWSAGTVSGTVGEMALYARNSTNNTWRWSHGGSYTPGSTMTSRLSVADGEFEAFTIDNSKPLTVDWKIRFAFS